MNPTDSSSGGPAYLERECPALGLSLPGYVPLALYPALVRNATANLAILDPKFDFTGSVRDTRTPCIRAGVSAVGVERTTRELQAFSCMEKAAEPAPPAPASGPLFADYQEDDDDEVFVLDIDHRFNVTDLLRRIERGQVPFQSGFVDIASWRASLAQSGIQPCDQYAAELPAERLQVPVICVTLAGGALLVIDGNHRLAKADAARLPGMPARIIDQATTESLRLLYEERY